MMVFPHMFILHGIRGNSRNNWDVFDWLTSWDENIECLQWSMEGILYLFLSSKNKVGRFCVWGIREMLINTLLFYLVVGNRRWYYQLYMLLLTGVCICISWFLFSKDGGRRWYYFRLWPNKTNKTSIEREYLCSAVLVNTYTIIIIYEALSKTRVCASGLCSLATGSPHNMLS